jgi:hypothetical protein
MIGLEDRQSLARDIEAAHQGGARPAPGLRDRRHRRAYSAALEGPRRPHSGRRQA